MPHVGRGAARLVFLAPGDVGKGRVEPISWMQTCRAFADAGWDVELVTLRVARPDSIQPEAVWRHFGVPARFAIRVLPTPLRHEASVRAFRLWGGAAAAAYAVWQAVRQLVAPRRLVVYARSPVLALPFVALRRVLRGARRPRLIFEAHALPARSSAVVVRAADLVVVNSRHLLEELPRAFDVPPGRVVHAPLGPFNPVRRHERDAARAAVGLPRDGVLACYSGKLVRDQNEFLLQTAVRLRSRLPDARLVLVGGNPGILEWTRRRVQELGLDDAVVLTGFVDPPRVELYQSSADVLVFHMDSALEHWAYATPAKAYEYMAVGRPVVATDLPLGDEVFGPDGERAVRVRERDPDALAAAVADVLARPEEAAAMAVRAAQWARGRTWDSRVRTILDALAAAGP